jgi:hypothetical protein
MIDIVLDDRGARRKFRTFTANLRDLGVVFRQLGKIKGADIDELFASGGDGKWPERAEEDAAAGERREEKTTRRAESIRRSAVKSLRTSLIYDIKRAGARARTGKGSTSALLKRKAALIRFEEALRRGPLDFEELARGDKRFVRRAERSIGRYQNAEEIAGRLLGKIAQSIVQTAERDSLTFESKIPWAGVHNKGGKVGRDADVPARTFLEWTPEDLDLLRALIIERGLAAFA